MTKTSKVNKIIELNPESKSSEKLKDRIDKPSGKLISPKSQDLLTRIGVYSLNIGSRFLSETYKAKESIGNFYGAIGFATLDVLARKNSKFKRLTKFGGYLFYVGSCGYDLILGLNDWNNLWPNLGNFALDVTMAYQLGKDTRLLYEGLESKKEDKRFGISKDLEGIASFFKEKFKEKDKSFEETRDSKSKLKDYLSSFGKGIVYATGYGVSAGYSFGKGAFEKLKENYSVYKAKQKEKSEFKKKDEKSSQERIEQKIKTAGFEDVSFKNKKEILEYCGKNPKFMKNYEIENAYGDFKRKPIKEQVQIIKEKRNLLEENLEQMENASLSKRFYNFFEIYDTKSELKNLKKILYELGVEEKNPPRAPTLEAYLKKKDEEKENGK